MKHFYFMIKTSITRFSCFIMSQNKLHNICVNGIIDTNRIAVGGHSFGGFTSLALYVTINEYYNP
jgi:hypothetical protein